MMIVVSSMASVHSGVAYPVAQVVLLDRSATEVTYSSATSPLSDRAATQGRSHSSHPACTRREHDDHVEDHDVANEWKKKQG